VLRLEIDERDAGAEIGADFAKDVGTERTVKWERVLQPQKEDHCFGGRGREAGVLVAHLMFL
jgi:hypothetical protein